MLGGARLRLLLLLWKRALLLRRRHLPALDLHVIDASERHDGRTRVIHHAVPERTGHCRERQRK
ncbi:MAG: hypothetical protein R6X25_03825, partial [Candidatus Krumholzibacteriia bacterium]